MTFEDVKSWPFQEARSLIKHIEAKGKKPGDVVTFETGYGPSGAPHIGTFAEVVRTLWVMKAFDTLTDNAYRTRLIMFSDDFDGLRKVPDGLPAWMNDHIDEPLSYIPNPYEDSSETSFGRANNRKLINFVNNILKTYDGSEVSERLCDEDRVTFMSSSESYMVGLFNNLLLRVWERYDDLMNVMLPTLTERKLTYSPFIPRGPDGRYVYDRIAVRGDKPGLMLYYGLKDGIRDDDNVMEIMVTTHSKLQWKMDWAMRWVKFDVDYEMSGKDLIDSVKASQKICRILGGTPPVGMTYELFLAEDGSKISKSKGNGFSLEEWLTYGTAGSLQMFLFQNPKAAKPLHLDLVPKFEDEYIAMRQKELTPRDAAWFFKADGYTSEVPNISFGLMVKLAQVSQAQKADDLVNYLATTMDLDNATKAWVHLMAVRVIAYAKVKGLYDRETRIPDDNERAAFSELATRYSMMPPGMTEEHYQYQVYEVGKKFGFDPLRSWFQALYECFFGSSSGPRFGTFTVAYGLDNTIKLLRGYESKEAA